MKPYLMKRSTGYQSINQTKDIDFKYLLNSQNIPIKNFKKNIIIFTRRSDDEITLLGPYLIAESINYIRIDEEDFIDKFEIEINITNSKKTEFILYYKGTSISSTDISLVWFRHFNIDTLTSRRLNKKELLFIRSQWHKIFNYISELDSINIINSPLKFEQLTKPKQLELAKKCDFSIIPTLITNSAKSVRSLLNSKNQDLFIKSVDHHFLEVKLNKYMELYGGKVTSVPEVKSLQISPAIFQPMLDGSKEVRVTVIGNQTFAAIQKNVINDDWHKENMKKIKLYKIKVPSHINTKINHFSLLSNLTIYSIDFFVSENNWIFVEANVQGDWNWVEERTLQPISKTIASYLSHV